MCLCRAHYFTRESDVLPYFAGNPIAYVYAGLTTLPANVDSPRISQVKR